MELRDAIKHLRSELGLTQVELAMGLHINSVTVGRWENGKTSPTRSITALLLDYARAKGASKECLTILKQAIDEAAKSKIDSSQKGIYSVEHASLRQLIDEAPFSIYVCDYKTDEIVYVNKAADAASIAQAPVLGKSCYKLLMNRNTPCTDCHKAELIEDRFKEYKPSCAQGGPTYHLQDKLTVWNGRKAHVICVISKTTEQEQSNGTAETVASEFEKTDSLTGALKPEVFVEKVNTILSSNPTATGALIMLDIDGLKRLNDTFAYSTGDQALREVAAVLRSYARGDDLVCRLGGDEFVVWLRDIPYDAVLGKTAAQICEHIRKAYSQELLLTASAGIAVYPRDGSSYDELRQNAEKAVRKAKDDVTSPYAFFSSRGEEQSKALAENSSAMRPAPQLTNGAKRKLLIVDGDKRQKARIEKIFKDEYLIESAQNGEEAMDCLQRLGTSLSVVLLDVSKPEVGGFSVLKKMQSDTELRTIPVIVLTLDDERVALLKAFELGAAEYVTKPVDVDIVRIRVQAVINKTESERLRAQNSYLMLQQDEEVKFRTVLKSTGTVVIEYDWRNDVFVYDSEISKHIAGTFNHRSLWEVFLSDKLAERDDVQDMQDKLVSLASKPEQSQDSKLLKIKTPEGVMHWFRMNIYKSANDYGLTKKIFITFNDVHAEVLANEKLLFQTTHDELTGLYNRTGFLKKAEELISKQKPGYYVVSCIDIEKFQIINDQYGTEKGDEVLCYVASTMGDYVEENKGICCRYAADRFIVLLPAKLLDTQELENNHKAVSRPPCIPRSLRLCIGRCLVTDTSLSISALFDRAFMAQALGKGRYDTSVVNFDESMRDHILQEQQLVGDMVDALKNGEFVPWFQPQYNHETGALIGAEALVRWHKNDTIIPPNDFIFVFERNGFIYEIDQSIWRQVCILLRRWLDEGKNPLPVSVNISRYDLFQEGFLDVLMGLIEEYRLPPELLRLEITESAFSVDTTVITDIAGKLIDAGFTVEIDDFGSGYSSLNTLKDVPASILKLDVRFFETTENSKRGGNIVEAVVRMAKWLGMSIIAEGVEDRVQADYLKSIGCYYIQGYYYSKPLPVEEYEAQMQEGLAEHNLLHLETLESLDSGLFWDPKSMETLIFNSYVGGACIFEHKEGSIELLRYNDQFVSELHGLIPSHSQIQDISIIPFFDEDSVRAAYAALQEALESGKEASSELRITKDGQTEYVRQTSRVIAKESSSTLYYCVIQNLTEKRELERERTANSERLSIIMSNVNGGVSAMEIDDDGKSHLIFHNDKYYDIYGYTQSKEGETEIDPLSFIIPEDFPGVMEKVRKLKADGKPSVIEYGIIKQDGSRAQIRANASLMTMEGYGPIITSVLTDITEQRTLEEQLRVILDNINGGVSATYFSDKKQQFAFANDTYFEILGYTREQYAAEVESTLDLVHPDDRKQVEQQYAKAVQDEKPYTMEYRVIRRDGTIAYILCNANTVHLFGLKEATQLAVFNDISLLKEAQKKEQALNARLQMITGSVQGGITAIVLHENREIEFIFANDGFYELLGYTKEEYETEVPSSFDLILSEDIGKTIETVNRILRERGSESYEYRCRKRDGSIIWLQATNTVISLEGVSDRVLLGFITDISELRQAREQSLVTADRLSAVMNAMTNGITAVSGQDPLQYLFANDRFYQMHGITQQDSARDTLYSILDIMNNEDRERVHSLVMSLNKVGQSGESEYRITLPNGEQRFIKITLTITKLINVDFPVQVAVYADITDEKESNEQIRFLNETAGEILAQQDSEKAIRSTLEKLLAYFAGERCYIFELDEQTQTFDSNYEVCAAGIEQKPNRLQSVPRDMQQYCFSVISRQGFMAMSDLSIIEEDKIAMQEFLLARGVHSIISVPLWRDGALIGYLGIENPGEAVDQVDRLIATTNYIAMLLTRRDLAEAIEHEQQQMQQLMDDSPGGFARLELFEDKNPTIISLNDGLCKLVGMTRDEALEAYGDNAFACLPDEIAALAPQEVRQAYAAGEQYTKTFQLKKKDGDLLWITLFGSFVHGKAGKLYLNAYFNDITQQKNIEQLESDLLENLPFGAALYEFDGEGLQALHINKHYWELVDRPPLSPEEVSAFAAFHPEDKSLVINELKQAIGQARSASCTARIRCGDGSFKPFAMVTNNVREKDGRYLLYVTFTPLSEEELAIQKMLPVALSTIVDNTDAMSYVKDREGRYIAASQSILELSGLQSFDEIIGKTAQEVFDSSMSQQFDEDDKRILETGKPAVRVLEHIPKSDGSVILARTTKLPILDAAGKAIGVYCVSHNISAEKERESQLELLTKTIPGGLAAFSLSNTGITTLYFNDGFYDYSGYTREEYIALTEDDPLALILDEDKHSMYELIQSFRTAKEDGMTGGCVYRCKSKEGKIRWMSLKGVLSLVSEDTYVLNVVQLDISERVKANQRQVDLLDNLPFGAAMYEFDGEKLRVIHLNKQYSQLVKREVDFKQEAYDSTVAIHPDDRKRTIDEIISAIEQKRDGICDIRLLCGDGKYRFFHLDASIVPSIDDKHTLYVAYTPITDKEQEYKNTSEQLKLLSDSIPGGIAIFRCQAGSIEPIYYTDGICTLSGYSREEFDSSTISVLDLIFDEDKVGTKKHLERLMRGEKALDYSLRIHTKNGGYKWVECQANVTGQEGKDVFLISAVLTDVTEQQEERERLRISEELNRLAIAQSGKIISRYEVASRTLTLPDELPSIYNLPRVLENIPEEQISLGRISPDTADAYREVYERVHSGQVSGEAVYQQQSSLGWRWLKSQFTTVFSSDGNPVSAVMTFEDITELREKEAIYNRWQNAMAERSEDSFTIVRCNISKTSMYDSWEGNLLPMRFKNRKQSFNSRTAEYADRFIYADDKKEFCAFLNSDTMLVEYYRGHRSDSIDYRELTGDGGTRWLRLSVDLVEYADSKDVEAYLLFENIDEEKHAELSAIQRAESDSLTGVLNRTTFSERVDQYIERFGADAQHAFFILDIDDFKRINDLYGHRAGDQALIEVADILTHCCRKDDLVGRLGGDEFFVFLPNIGSSQAAEKRAQQICEMTRKSLTPDIQSTSSIGIALSPQDGVDFEALYKAADEALYSAKHAGKDGYSFSCAAPLFGRKTKETGE